jgi:ABC-2 type transport system ATP-binding protein
VQHLKAEWRIDSKEHIGNLSEGEAQKVAIILALGHEPELLILDEPVASLDPLGRRQFLKMILDIVFDRKCTVFFSTHITSDLERVADHVAILNEGVVQFFGELEELKDTVKRLRIIGSNPKPEDIGMGGLIYYNKTDEGVVVTVKDFCSEMQGRLAEQLHVDVQVEDLNLEEIFLEMSR